jgi:hypothetical protein
MYPNGPQSITIGMGDASSICTAQLKLWGHASMGPNAVDDQSNARIRWAISPPQPSQP